MVKIVETKMKANSKRSKVSRKQQHHPITKKKLKQMTLLDTFAKSPKVIVSPLRLPLDVLKSNSSRHQHSVNVKSMNPVDTLLRSSSDTGKNENKNLINGTNVVVKKPVRIKKVWSKPQPTLVCLPSGLKNSNFGEALFICQFLVDFSTALEVPVTFEISTDNLIKAVAHGLEGFDYISSIILIFLTAVSSDTQKNLELGVKLSHVAFTSYSAPEVARLLLINSNNIKYNKEMKALLSTKEFHELEPSSLLEALSCLCEIAVECQVVRSYVEQIEEQRTNLFRKRPSMLILEKELNAKTELLKEKTQPKITGQLESTEQQESPLERTTLSTDSFYGDNSLGSKTQRQLMAEKLRFEKAQAELEKRNRYKEENEIAKLELKLNKFTTDMKIVCNDYKNLLRLNPIGTDGDDNRYWWFSHNSLHLVMEKSWQFNEKTTSSDWYTFDSSQHSQLQKALDKQIDKERSLKSILKNKIVEVSKLKTGTSLSNELVLVADWKEKSIQSLKDELKNLLEFIIDDVLAGWMLDFENWRKRLSHAENILQMRNLLMDVYRSLHGSCVKKISSLFPLEKWSAEVEKCNSIPRMHFLVTVLRAYLTRKAFVGMNTLSSAESSSSEDEDSKDDDAPEGERKCSRCKRSGDDLFECIECSMAFHLKCYKPQLRHPPRAWVCEKCKRHQTSFPVNKSKITVKARNIVKPSRLAIQEGRRRSPRIRE